jgi:hypothetical protein
MESVLSCLSSSEVNMRIIYMYWGMNEHFVIIPPPAPPDPVRCLCAINSSPARI